MKKPDKFIKECGKDFEAKEEPMNVLREFTLEKPCKCNEYGKVFTQRETLHRHQIIHVGEKLYKCKEYGKFFSRKINLKLHNRNSYWRETYKFNECGRVFWHRATCSFHQHSHAERDLTNPMSVARTLVKKKALQFIIKEVILGRNLTNVVSVARSSVERISFQFIIEFTLERKTINVMSMASFF